jgi:hypothetical protein
MYMSPIELDNDDAFLNCFLAMVADNDNAKLVPAIDSQGQPLDAFQIAWSASIAEEQGHYPLISTPAHGVNYFVFFSKVTGMTGYLSFYPSNC